MSEQHEDTSLAQPPLQAISNVIELKPSKKYLLVFKGENIHHDELEHVAGMLGELGIECLGVALSDGQELTVIEAPAEPEPEQELPYLRREQEL